MDWLWIILGILFIIAGIGGCLLPILPGPPISYVGLLMLQLTNEKPLSGKFLIIWALITIAVVVLDYIVPVYGTKKFGGSKLGVWGSIIGLVVGLFFAPLGIIIGPFVGAIGGELLSGKDTNTAVRAGFGSFIGFLFGTLLKLIASVMMAYYFFANMINMF